MPPLPVQILLIDRLVLHWYYLSLPSAAVEDLDAMATTPTALSSKPPVASASTPDQQDRRTQTPLTGLCGGIWEDKDRMFGAVRFVLVASRVDIDDTDDKGALIRHSLEYLIANRCCELRRLISITSIPAHFQGGNRISCTPRLPHDHVVSLLQISHPRRRRHLQTP